MILRVDENKTISVSSALSRDGVGYAIDPSTTELLDVTHFTKRPSPPVQLNVMITRQGAAPVQCKPVQYLLETLDETYPATYSLLVPACGSPCRSVTISTFARFVLDNMHQGYCVWV